MSYIQKLHLLLNRKTKQHLFWLVFFSIFISIVETVGVSVIMPFIDISTNFGVIHSNQYYQYFFNFFNFESDVNFVIVFGFTLIGFYLFRGGVNLLYNHIMAVFSENIYAQTTKKLFKAYLSMPYQTFVNKNSSYLTKAIVTEASLVSLVIKSVLLMISEVFIIIFLYVLMLIASWKITLVFTIILSIKMIFLTQTISKRIKSIGATRAEVQAEFYEIINRMFGDFKQVKLQEKKILESVRGGFDRQVTEYANANASNAFLSSFPKLFLETSGFLLIVALLVALLYLGQSEVAYILPTLSLFVLSLYRLLPSVHRIVSGYNSLLYYHKSIDIINEELKIPQEAFGDDLIRFIQKIELKNISFFYHGRAILTGISLTINKGDKIAFVGESGSGKSTLVDVIIGLNRPSKGEIHIDNILLDDRNLQSWRPQVGYIPQQVYLFDGTISENVCFGREVDSSLLKKVLKQANIFNFLQTKEGTETLVGEGGIQLSGGQKQRIAIARALYGQPEILILDEATSALDNKTEEKIMNEIYQSSQDKTLIIIAHRLSTIQGCDRVFKIKSGRLIEQ